MTTEAPQTYTAHPAANLFPMLAGEELSELANDIQTHGLQQPVHLYDDADLGTVVLDGRNRLAACKLAGIEPRTVFYVGDDPIGFSVSQNVKRRHLTTGQLAAVAYASEALYAEQGRKRQAEAAAQERRERSAREAVESAKKAPPLVEVVADRPQPAKPAPVQPEAPKARAPLARDHAAKTVGTSGRSVARYKRVIEDAPDLAAKVRAGDLALDRAERLVRDRDAEQRRVTQARTEAAMEGTTYRVDIRHGDFRETLADLTNIDAIITDPPYPAEFLPLLGDMAEWADQVLAPDGVMAVLIGQTHLPEVYRLLSGHRPYRWTGCYLTSGPAYASHARRLQSSWKPILIYGGGPRFADTINSTGDDKAHHKWGQNYDAFRTIIERLTTKGQTVVDPFMGAGTTLLAGHALGRHVIGSDTDLEAVQTTKERLL